MIDDFHPAQTFDIADMNSKAQKIIRAVGDHVGRGRLKADCSQRDTFPPTGNVIMTGETLPKVHESGLARLLILELNAEDVNNELLSKYQEYASKGIFREAMFMYLGWLKNTCLSKENYDLFIQNLRLRFTVYRNDFSKRLSPFKCHNRMPDTLASLKIGLDFMLDFYKGYDESLKEFRDTFDNILMKLAVRNSSLTRMEKTSFQVIYLLFSGLESNKFSLMPLQHLSENYPQGFIGFEDDNFIYLRTTKAVPLLNKFSVDMGNPLNLNEGKLLKLLDEECLLICASNGSKTKPKKINGTTIRCAFVEKRKAIELYKSML